jgi:hypothetical protein
MPPINRLVTRGMGPSRGTPGRAGMITQGYGGIFRAIIEAVSGAIQGGSKALRRLPEILWSVYARLSTVNELELTSGVEGVDKKLVDPNIGDPKIAADLESTGISRRPSGIVIVAERVQRGKKEGN